MPDIIPAVILLKKQFISLMRTVQHTVPLKVFRIKNINIDFEAFEENAVFFKFQQKPKMTAAKNGVFQYYILAII